MRHFIILLYNLQKGRIISCKMTSKKSKIYYSNPPGGIKMKKETKMEILKTQINNYFKASKKEKGRILDSFCKICNFSRKHAIKLFTKPYVSKPEKKVLPKRKRLFKYSSSMFCIIAQVWRAFNYSCGPKLKAIFFASPYISPATLNRRLIALTRTNKRKFPHSTILHFFGVFF